MTTAVAREPVESLALVGATAFTTTRDAGDFAVPASGVDDASRQKWEELLRELAPAARLASARQVHGNRVLTHGADWTGWRRADSADGHVTAARGTALAVSVADCVPVFLAHVSGAVGVLHAGWRGVVAGVLRVGLDAMSSLGAPAGEVHVHLGPAISGRSYEVGPDVYAELTGWETQRPRRVDLRAILAEQARAHGVRHLTASHWCTLENNDRFFSHRAGNSERQVAVIVAG